jgi:glycosyltransferase involved in cell wall biosynthesis
MRILVVHEVSYLKKVAYEIHEFPELLSVRGHEITFFDFDEGAFFTRMEGSRDRVISGRIHSTAKLRLVTAHRFGIPGLDRVWAIFSSLPALTKLLRKGDFDVVLNYAVPTFGLQINLLGRLFGVPVLQRALDVSGKIRKHPLNPLIALFERACFGLATRVSTNNPAMTKHVLETMGQGFQSRITMHYPPLDRQIFKPVERDGNLAAKLGIKPGDKVMMYMGSFFYFSGLDVVLRDMAKSGDATLKLLLIGGGEQAAELRALTADLGLNDRVIFTGYVAFRELPRYMCLGQVAINPLKAAKVASAAFPHKVLQYMAVGIPTVSTKLEGLYKAFGDESGLLWCDDSSSILQGALNLLDEKLLDREKRVKLQSNSLDIKFSTEGTVSKLEATLREIAEEGLAK